MIFLNDSNIKLKKRGLDCGEGLKDMVFEVGVARLGIPAGNFELKVGNIGLEFGDVVVEIGDLGTKSVFGEASFETLLLDESEGWFCELRNDVHEEERAVPFEVSLVLG